MQRRELRGAHGLHYQHVEQAALSRPVIEKRPLYEDYQPGYYYDEAYTDGLGTYYPRTYYYYDGHHWLDRDDVPRGYIAQRRHEREEHETRAFREDRDHHGEHRDGDRDDLGNRRGDNRDGGRRDGHD